MPSPCCVTGCDRARQRHATTSVHRFPPPRIDMKRLELWIKMIGGKIANMDSVKVYKTKVICSRHFKPEAFSPCYSPPRLKENALPTEFLGPLSGYYQMMKNDPITVNQLIKSFHSKRRSIKPNTQTYNSNNQTLKFSTRKRKPGRPAAKKESNAVIPSRCHRLEEDSNILESENETDVKNDDAEETEAEPLLILMDDVEGSDGPLSPIIIEVTDFGDQHEDIKSDVLLYNEDDTHDRTDNDAAGEYKTPGSEKLNDGRVATPLENVLRVMETRADEHLEVIRQMQHSHWSTVERSPMRAFCEGMADTVMRFPPALAAEVKTAVCELMGKYEIRLNGQ